MLGDFSDDELKALQPAFEIIANALDSFIDGANIQALQNRYTRKKVAKNLKTILILLLANNILCNFHFCKIKLHNICNDFC